MVCNNKDCFGLISLLSSFPFFFAFGFAFFSSQSKNFSTLFWQASGKKKNVFITFLHYQIAFGLSYDFMNNTANQASISVGDARNFL